MRIMAKNTSKMDGLISKLNKSYGNLGIFSGRRELSNEQTISTGSYLLDDAIGPWGLPRGRVVQYAGKESSGKTFMSLMAIKSWQERSPENWALFIDAEYTYDEDWAESLGVDINRVKVLPENNGEVIFKYLCGVPNKEFGKPKKVDGLLDEIKAAGGADATGLGLIVIDSVAAIAPPAELASESGKHNMALMARFMPPELRKITPLLAQTGVTLIAINQVRLDPGKMFGNPESTPGGKAWKHACSLMVNFSVSESNAMKIFSKDDETQIGHILKSRIDKNKIGKPYVTCEFGIEYVKGLSDPVEELRQLAIKYGVVKRPNNRTYVYNDMKWTSKEEYSSSFKTKEEQDKLFEEIKQCKLNGVVAMPANIEESTEGEI